MTGLGRERLVSALARGTYNEYGAWRAMCVSLCVYACVLIYLLFLILSCLGASIR